MKGFFMFVVVIAIVAAIGYGVWSVANSSGLGHSLNQNRQTESELEK